MLSPAPTPLAQLLLLVLHRLDPDLQLARVLLPMLDVSLHLRAQRVTFACKVAAQLARMLLPVLDVSLHLRAQRLAVACKVAAQLFEGTLQIIAGLHRLRQRDRCACTAHKPFQALIAPLDGLQLDSQA